MMENLQLNNCEQFNFWDEINNLGWYWLTKNKNTNPNDELGVILVERYSLDEIVELHNFVVRQRIQLKAFLEGYYKASSDEFKSKFKLSDDGLWDLCSHVVGLGQVMYDYVMDHPEIVLELQKDYTENFEYGFDKAIYMINFSK